MKKTKIILEVTDQAEEQLIPLLEKLKDLGDRGASREVVVAPGDNDLEEKFGFDGDGASSISSIRTRRLMAKGKQPDIVGNAIRFLIEAAPKPIYKKGDRVIVDVSKDDGIWVATITKVTPKKIYVRFDDGDKLDFSAKSKKFLGKGTKKKRKSAIPKKDVKKWLAKEKKVKAPVKKARKKGVRVPNKVLKLLTNVFTTKVGQKDIQYVRFKRTAKRIILEDIGQQLGHISTSISSRDAESYGLTLDSIHEALEKAGASKGRGSQSLDIMKKRQKDKTKIREKKTKEEKTVLERRAAGNSLVKKHAASEFKGFKMNWLAKRLKANNSLWMPKVNRWIKQPEDKVITAVGKLESRDLDSLVKFLTKAQAFARRDHNSRYGRPEDRPYFKDAYTILSALLRLAKSALGGSRFKEAKKRGAKKKPHTFYPKHTGTDVPSYMRNVGTVQIDGKDYEAVQIPMSGGKQGVAVQTQRFGVGEEVEVWSNRTNYWRPTTVTQVKREVSKGYILWRYYYGDRFTKKMPWMRDFFEDGKRPDIKRAK
jgi:hypothetical protein